MSADLHTFFPSKQCVCPEKNECAHTFFTSKESLYLCSLEETVPNLLLHWCICWQRRTWDITEICIDIVLILPPCASVDIQGHEISQKFAFYKICIIGWVNLISFSLVFTSNGEVSFEVWCSISTSTAWCHLPNLPLSGPHHWAEDTCYCKPDFEGSSENRHILLLARQCRC